jgi:hypothetical protein
MTDGNDRLTLTRLAEECDVAERYVERLVEFGFLEPTEHAFSWSDFNAGMSLERMAPHSQSGRLSLAFELQSSGRQGSRSRASVA